MINIIYLVRDRINVSRVIAVKIDLDMHTTPSLCHCVISFWIHEKLYPPISSSVILSVW